MTSPHWCGVLMSDVAGDVAVTDDRVAGRDGGYVDSTDQVKVEAGFCTGHNLLVGAGDFMSVEVVDELTGVIRVDCFCSVRSD